MAKPKLTPKQQGYVDARKAGLDEEAAALKAGYSPKGIKAQLERLRVHEGVQKAIDGTWTNGKPGRPAKFDDPESLQEVIDEYFESVTIREQETNKITSYKPTMSGLAYALGMTRQTLCDYNSKEGFSDIIKSARQRVEIALEANLYNNGVTGTIFNLKNNFGWKDKIETDVTSGGKPIKNEWHIHPVTTKVDDGSN